MGADQYPPLVKSAISLLEELFGQIASVVGPEPTLPALFYTFFTFHDRYTHRLLSRFRSPCVL